MFEGRLNARLLHTYCICCSEFLPSVNILVDGVNLTCTVADANLNKSSTNVPTA